MLKSNKKLIIQMHPGPHLIDMYMGGKLITVKVMWGDFIYSEEDILRAYFEFDHYAGFNKADFFAFMFVSKDIKKAFEVGWLPIKTVKDYRLGNRGQYSIQASDLRDPEEFSDMLDRSKHSKTFAFFR